MADSSHSRFQQLPLASSLARAAALLLFASALSALASDEGSQRLKNQSFESATPAEFWQVERSEGKQEFSLSVDRAQAKDGAQSLLVQAAHPTNVILRQEISQIGRAHV